MLGEGAHAPHRSFRNALRKCVRTMHRTLTLSTLGAEHNLFALSPEGRDDHPVVAYRTVRFRLTQLGISSRPAGKGTNSRSD